MTQQDFVALSLKISGLVLLVLLVSNSPEYFSSYLQGTTPKSIWSFIVPLVIPGIIAIVLIKFPYSISNKFILPSTEFIEKSEKIVLLELILIRILALLLLFYATSDLVFHSTNYLILRLDINDFPLSGYNYPYFFTTIAEFIFAFWLLLGTKSVVKFFYRLRQS